MRIADRRVVIEFDIVAHRRQQIVVGADLEVDIGEGAGVHERQHPGIVDGVAVEGLVAGMGPGVDRREGVGVAGVDDQGAVASAVNIARQAAGRGDGKDVILAGRAVEVGKAAERERPRPRPIQRRQWSSYCRWSNRKACRRRYHQMIDAGERRAAPVR